MDDEWASQDFSSLALEAIEDPDWVPTPLLPSETQAEFPADAAFDPGQSAGPDPDLTFLLPDEFLIVGNKTFDAGPLSHDDGVDLGEIVVPPPARRPDYDPPVIPEYDGGNVPPYSPAGGGDTGVGGGQTPVLPPPCSALPPPVTPAEVEAQADEIVRRIDTFISTLNWQTQEYGVLIYIGTDGVVRAGQIALGYFGPTGTPQVDPDATGIGAYSQIIGYYHNHPTLGGTPGADHNRPSAADFSSMQGIVSPPNGQPGANPNQLGIYLRGPDGVVRQFSLADAATPGSQGTVLSPGTTGCSIE